jgi:hypothetical protein
VKIGIITFHGENNYGAVLQAVALKIILDEFGKTNIINYSSNLGATQMLSVLVEKNDFMKHQVSNIMLSLLANSNKVSDAFKPLERIYKFRKFIKEYGSITKLYSYEELYSDNMEGFDVYVSGSDQIWNPMSADMDPVFFSSFAPANSMKISYASSTGDCKFNKDQEAIIKQNLSSFRYISTREKNTVKVLKDLTGKEVELVLDPTLLLDKELWKKMVNINRKFQEQPYLLVYSMSSKTDIFQIAHSIAKSKGLKVYNITNWYSAHKFVDNKKYVDKYFADAGPNEFLDLFYNASFIVTDSFHGTIFSINFNKTFIAVKPPSSSGRVLSILNILGLKDRLVSNFEEFKKADIVDDIDYKVVNDTLDKQRIKSIGFLKKALNEVEYLEEA